MNSNFHRTNRGQFITSCFVTSIFLSGCQSLSSYHANDDAKTWVDIEPPENILIIDPAPLDIDYVQNKSRIIGTINTIATHKFILADNQDLVGKIATIRTYENDTLPDIARHFGLGYNEITIVNSHIDPWVPEPNSQVVLPLRFILPSVEREGLVLNLASMRLFHFSNQTPKTVTTYPIGIGRKGWSTPTGITKIIEKKKPLYGMYLRQSKESMLEKVIQFLILLHRA